jgi:outer membrane lipoprotein LolB
LFSSTLLIKRIFILICLLTESYFLSGCASVHSQEKTFSQLSPTLQSNIHQQEQALSQKTQFTLQGAVSVTQPKERVSLFAHWIQQDKNHYTITLIAPGGTSTLTLSARQPNSVVLETGDGKHTQAQTPEILLQQTLGWHMPITPLYYWIRGLAAPGSKASTSYGLDGGLKTLAQDGWQIDYLAFQSVQDLRLPKKLLLTHPKYQLQLKILINTWILRA